MPSYPEQHNKLPEIAVNPNSRPAASPQEAKSSDARADCYMVYEEYKPGQIEEYESSEGLRFVRTGPINAGIFRHPDEDWITDNLSGGTRIQLAGIFIYNPNAGEIRIERVPRSDQYFRIREDVQAGGWWLVTSCLDRIIGYRPFNQKNNPAKK